jgi:nicotinamidase-related amidase
MPNQTPYQPLTSQNAALVLVDHQVGLMTGVRDYSTGELKHNVVALAKAAKALKLPIVVTTTARDSMWGPTFPELGRVHANRRASTMNAKERKARKMTSSFSKREKMRRKPFSLRKSRSISLRFL